MTSEKKIQNCFWKFEKHVPRARGDKTNFLKAFLREWSEYLEVFVKPVSIKVFFSKSQQSNLRKAFFKKAINILSIYLHHLKGTLEKSRVRCNPATFSEKNKTKNYINKFTCFSILCLLCRKSYLLNFFTLPLILLNLVAIRFDKKNCSGMLVNESSLRVYFIGWFHSIVVYQKCECLQKLGTSTS